MLLLRHPGPLRDTYLLDGLRACGAGTQLRFQSSQTEGDTRCRATC
jgi:hypothetical protein